MTNTTPKIRIGIDLDGVIYNFLEEFRDKVSLKRNIDPTTLPEPTEWAFYRDWGISDDEYLDIVMNGAIRGEFFKDGSVYADAQLGMKQLVDMGLEVVVITARKIYSNPEYMQVIRTNTENWLAANNIPYSQLIIDHDKTRHGLDILVDDSIENVEDFILSGEMAYIFNRPWNQNAPFYSRVMDWEDLIFEMKNLQNKFRIAFQSA